MYVVSSYGRVFSLFTGKEMRQTSNTTKNTVYTIKQVHLQRKYNMESKMFSVHRLVAMAFIFKTQEDVIYNKDYVNHKDLLPWNNVAWNLEWCTQQENVRHAFDNGCHGKTKLFTELNPKQEPTIHYGDEHALCRVTDEQVHAICKALEKGEDYKTCCDIAGLEYNRYNLSVISNIKTGKRRTNISSQYNIINDVQPIYCYDSHHEKIKELLIKDYCIKEVYDIIKNDIPFKDGENEKKHYDRTRAEIRKIKKQLIKEGILYKYDY